MTVAISALSKVGLVRETGGYGTGGSPAVLVPCEPPDLSNPFEQILDQGLRGKPALDFGAWRGPGHTEGSISHPTYPDVVGNWLLGIMGKVSTSGTAAPYTHTFTLANTSPSFAIQEDTKKDGKVANYRYQGMKVNEFSFRFNAAEGLVGCSTSFSGKDVIEAPAGENVPDYTGAKPDTPFKGSKIEVRLGGSLCYAMEGELTLAREVGLLYTGDGTDSPKEAFAGPLEVTGRLTLAFENTAQIDRYLNATQEPFKFVVEYGTSGQTKHRKLTALATKMDFGESAPSLDESGTYITLEYGMRALWNTTDGGPIQFELINEESSY